MRLFRRKLSGDRLVWLVVAAATVFVVYQWRARGGDTRLYILVGWLLLVGVLFGYGELRIGRKQLRRGRDAMFLGLAAFVGEETVSDDGSRRRGWTGMAAGALAFEPQGIRWVPKFPDDGPPEIAVAWPDVYSWRLTGVVPFVWRASGYFLLSVYGGRELVFAIHGIRAWRRAVREAMIIGPTLLPREAGALESPPIQTPEAAPPEVVDVAFEAVIGLECHVELATNSKMFCGCPTTFGTEPNTQVCPVCSGQPGTLPVPNRGAIEYALRIGLALHCAVTPESIFHRKNYFYPDMPKNYQISQYDIPLCTGGFLDVEVSETETKRVGIERVHLEEDTGKTIHAGEGGRIGEADYAKIDYNRAGIPLVEIVSEPDMRTPEEARAYVAELRGLLAALGVSDVRMEEGSLRVDANVSVRPRGSEEFGTKVEIKNMNSLRSVQRALAFEIERQTELAKQSRPITQETRHFDESTGQTIGGRSKEYSSDYRYFPDPDLLPLAPSLGWIESIRGSMPELPAAKRQRVQTTYGLAVADVRTLVSTPGLADAFESAAAAYGGDGPSIARWYLGELAQLGNEQGKEPHEVGVSPAHVAELQRLVDDQKISISLAKGEVLRKVAATGRTPAAIVAEAGLAQISDEGELARMVEEVIAENQAIADQYRGGKEGAINALVGKVMQRTRGQANAQVVQRLLAEKLGPATQV